MKSHLLVFPLLHQTPASYTWLLDTAMVFGAVVTGILLFILFFLQQKDRKQQRKTLLRHLYSDLIAETAICESPEEVEETLQQFLAANKGLLRKPFSRKVLIRELVKARDNISGQSAENLRILFEKLELDKDCLAHFTSSQWHRKTSAIQHLAEMQQSQYLVRIYKETNNTNYFIRTEAQIAAVKLTGFKGLRFLTVISHPISQWQQLALINQLQEADIEEEKIKQWLSAENESVVEFALRLTAIYKCYGLYSDVLNCLQHASLPIRLQALQALKEVAGQNTSGALLQHFSNASREEQREILTLICEIGDGNEEVSFLTSLLHHPDEAIRFHATKGLQQISPAKPSVTLKDAKIPAAPTYFLSTPEKKAV